MEKGQVIYEVSLVIDEEIWTDFQYWLTGHIKNILTFPGFIKANILRPENERLLGKEKLTIQYQLEDRQSLENYFQQYADQMRNEGIARFKDKFSAQRRIFLCENQVSRS